MKVWGFMFSIFALIFLTMGCQANTTTAGTQATSPAFYITPTKNVSVDQWPQFDDDLDFAWMNTAIDRQLKRFVKKDLSGNIRLGNVSYPLSHMRRSLELFQALIRDYQICARQSSRPSCMQKFNDQMKLQFDLFSPHLEKSEFPNGDEVKTAFFTAYYTPSIEVETVSSPRFPYAIYAQPEEPQLSALTRDEIDFQGKLKKSRYVLFYASNLFDLYLMHIQGGGRVKVMDKKGQPQYYLSYAGTNGKLFRFISLYMKEKGMISDLSVESQRVFLKQNPDKQREVYQSCPSYVFFKISAQPPDGSDSTPLTDNRSLATDKKYYPAKGLLSFVRAQRPIDHQWPVIYSNFSRFFIDQDTGGAIRGKARADLYFGEGSYAEMVAYNLNHYGEIYFLIAK